MGHRTRLASPRSLRHTGRVHEFCSCGVRLPEDARFCHKCGKPQFEEDIAREPVAAIPPPAIPQIVSVPREISFHNVLAVRIGFLMALLSSVLIQLLSPLLFVAVPIVTGLVTAGGAAAYFYSKKSGQRLSIRNGSRMGWITGIFCFVIFLVMTTINFIAVSLDKGIPQFFKDELSQRAVQTADVDQLIKALQTPEGLGAFVFAVIALMFVVFTILPTIGGAIGSKFSARE